LGVKVITLLILILKGEVFLEFLSSVARGQLLDSSDFLRLNRLLTFSSYITFFEIPSSRPSMPWLKFILLFCIPSFRPIAPFYLKNLSVAALKFSHINVQYFFFLCIHNIWVPLNSKYCLVLTRKCHLLTALIKWKNWMGINKL
jgi:hypothetical protein